MNVSALTDLVTNLRAENTPTSLEAAAFIQSYIDSLDGAQRKNNIIQAITDHNTMCANACNSHRQDPGAPCGGTPQAHCPDCPRSLGLHYNWLTISG